MGFKISAEIGDQEAEIDATGDQETEKTGARSHIRVYPPNMAMQCLHCGEQYEPATPCPVELLAAMLDAFHKKHSECVPKERGVACSWCRRFGHSEDACPSRQYDGDYRKWLAGPDTGSSSKFLCYRLAGMQTYPVSAPSDPADFGRCYRLLQAIPGWRERINELSDIPAWAPLVKHWDELEQLYLEESPSGQAPKLFERMTELRQRDALRAVSTGSW